MSLPGDYQALEREILDGDGDRAIDCDYPGEYDGACDCDDEDASIGPEADEACDGVDNDCDELVDEGVPDVEGLYFDADGDGYGDPDAPVVACPIPVEVAENADDCDDGTSDRAPGLDEACDEVDNDCDGDVDEGLDQVWYRDRDGDGVGDAGDTLEGCARPAGYVDVDGDCDDDDSATYPGAEEICGDGVLNDCDGSEDACDWVGSIKFEDDDRVAEVVGPCTRFGSTLAVASFIGAGQADLVAGCTDSSSSSVIGMGAVQEGREFDAETDTVWNVGRSFTTRGPEIVIMDMMGGPTLEVVFGSPKAEEVALYDRNFGQSFESDDAEWVVGHTEQSSLGASLGVMSVHLETPYVAVGAPDLNQTDGAVYVLGGAAIEHGDDVEEIAGTVLRGDKEGLGSALGSRCDLDSDGVYDLVAGGDGTVVFVSAPSGTLVSADADGVLTSSAAGFGSSVTCLDSTAGPLLAVGGPGAGSDAGVVQLFSAFDGEANSVATATVSIGQSGDEFGTSVTLGSFQSWDDLLVAGAPGFDTAFSGADEGMVLAFDATASGSLTATDAIFDFRTGVIGGGVGAAATLPGDVTSDGLPDIAVGADSTGSVYFLTGLEL